jgi:DNA-binding transcriptional LysR family regulator
MSKTMDRLEAMSMFLAAVEHGSLSAAARQMRVPVPTLSRKVAELEALLGTQLLTRTTRKLTLTDAGVTYAAASRHILELVNDAQREAAGEFTMPTGELVITAPLLFGRLHVLPIIADFLALYPAINVRLALGDHIADLVDDGIDMAVRIGALPDSGMIATRVGSMRLVICGSPKLLKQGVPRVPDELRQKPCIAIGFPTSDLLWRFRSPDRQATIEIPIAPRLATTTEAALDAAIRGLGFVRLRYYQALEALRAGKLGLVLEAYEPEPAPIHLVHVSRGQMPLKMRGFLDFAAPRLRKSLAAMGSVA